MEEYKMMKACEELTKLTKTEPAKTILDNMDAILNELWQELVRIDSAIYSSRPTEERERNPADECLLGILNRQRATAKKLLDLTIHIREGLW